MIAQPSNPTPEPPSNSDLLGQIRSKLADLPAPQQQGGHPNLARLSLRIDGSGKHIGVLALVVRCLRPTEPLTSSLVIEPLLRPTHLAQILYQVVPVQNPESLYLGLASGK
jgi:hypothetical protein